MTTLDAFTRALKTRLAPLENPYFRALRDGSMSREDFVETQLQFAHAVFFFSRPMLVLAGRIQKMGHNVVGDLLYWLKKLDIRREIERFVKCQLYFL